MRLKDIIANMRNYADRLEASGGYPSPEDLRTFAGGIEHAIKELERATGNAAAMRDALENAISVFRDDLPTPRDISRAFAAANAALAAPARNCDRFATANDAVKGYIAAHPHDDEPDASTYGSWLFAPAAEGGEE